MFSLIIETTIYFKCISNMANLLISHYILLTILFLAASLFSFFILCLLTVKCIFIDTDLFRRSGCKTWGINVRQQSSTTDSPKLEYLSHSLSELQLQFIKEKPGCFSSFVC